MGYITTCHYNTDLGGVRFRADISIAPLAFPKDGGYERIVPTWVAGDAALPHRVDAAAFRSGIAAGGGWTVWPDRKDNDRYISFGAPEFKDAVVWQKTALSAAVRSAQTVSMQSAKGAWEIVHAGHYLKPTLLLPDGYNPTLLSFPVTMKGLDWKDGLLLADGKPLMHMREPSVVDDDNPMDVRPIKWEMVGGRLIFTLPKMDGMKKRRIDPILAIQPGATAGKDTYIVEIAPTFNQGVIAIMSSGFYASGDRYRPMLQFDLTGIPTGSLVSASSLLLTRSANNGTQAYTYGAYRMLRAWLEGTGTYNASGDGATWNTYDGVNNWGTAGCDNTTTDRLATGEDLHAVNYAANNTWSIPTMTQFWVNNPGNNYGTIIRTADAYVAQGRFVSVSSDDPTPANRPLLTVTGLRPEGRNIAYIPGFSTIAALPSGVVVPVIQ